MLDWEINKTNTFVKALIRNIETPHTRTDQTRRRQRFLVAMELIKRANLKDVTDKIKEPTGEPSFEIKGVARSGEIIGVHIREEKKMKDRKLYLISTF